MLLVLPQILLLQTRFRIPAKPCVKLMLTSTQRVMKKNRDMIILVLVCFIVWFVTFNFEDNDRSDGKEFADCKQSEIAKLHGSLVKLTEKRRQSDN